jgi:hypothetical protein
VISAALMAPVSSTRSTDSKVTSPSTSAERASRVPRTSARTLVKAMPWALTSSSVTTARCTSPVAARRATTGKPTGRP